MASEWQCTRRENVYINGDQTETAGRWRGAAGAEAATSAATAWGRGRCSDSTDTGTLDAKIVITRTSEPDTAATHIAAVVATFW